MRATPPPELRSDGVLRAVKIDLSTIAGNGFNTSNKTEFITDPEQRYHLSFDISQDHHVDQILSDAFQDELKAIQPPENYAEEFQETAEQAKTIGVELRSGRKKGAKRRTSALDDGFPVFRDAITLVINALFYLSAYPEEGSLEWPNDAPMRMVEKAEHGSTYKERRRSESKLLPLGFSRVRFCKLSPPYKANGQQGAVGGRKQHWRRGHWRNQPYGKDRELRKLIWILPVMVNKDSKDKQAGRIYTVA